MEDSTTHSAELALRGMQSVADVNQAAIEGGITQAIVESTEASFGTYSSQWWERKMADAVLLKTVQVSEEFPPENWIHLQFTWAGKPFTMEVAESDR